MGRGEGAALTDTEALLMPAGARRAQRADLDLAQTAEALAKGELREACIQMHRVAPDDPQARELAAQLVQWIEDRAPENSHKRAARGIRELSPAQGAATMVRVARELATAPKEEQTPQRLASRWIRELTTQRPLPEGARALAQHLAELASDEPTSALPQILDAAEERILDEGCVGSVEFREAVAERLGEELLRQWTPTLLYRYKLSEQETQVRESLGLDPAETSSQRAWAAARAERWISENATSSGSSAFSKARLGDLAQTLWSEGATKAASEITEEIWDHQDPARSWSRVLGDHAQLPLRAEAPSYEQLRELVRGQLVSQREPDLAKAAAAALRPEAPTGTAS